MQMMIRHLNKTLIIFSLWCWQIVASAAAAQNPQKLTIILDWFVNPDHAPLFVAQQQGFYRDENLNVEFITPADPADPPKLIAAGKGDLAIDYQAHFLLEAGQGLPLVHVGTLVNQPLTTLTVLASSPVQSIKDLKGKTVGVSMGGSVEEALLKVMLERNGLKLDDVQIVRVGYSLTSALLSKKVDAVTGMLRNVELVQLRLEGQPGRAFYPEQNGFPPFAELIIVAQNAKAHDPRIAAFLRALQKGVAYLKEHPSESWQVFAAQHPELNNEFNKQSWMTTYSYFYDQPAKLDEAQCVNVAAVLTKVMSVKIPKEACRS